MAERKSRMENEYRLGNNVISRWQFFLIKKLASLKAALAPKLEPTQQGKVESLEMPKEKIRKEDKSLWDRRCDRWSGKRDSSGVLVC